MPISQLREWQTLGIIQSIFLFLRAFIIGRAAAAVENLALRQRVAVLKHSVKRPKVRPRDRVNRIPIGVLSLASLPMRWLASVRRHTSVNELFVPVFLATVSNLPYRRVPQVI